MEYVSFRIGKELYAIDVWHAREVVDTPAVSQMPNAPDWIFGMMNLRGRIVPVVDLKKKFGLAEAAEAAAHARTYVVVVELPGDDGDALPVGLLADAVLEVFDFDPAQLAPPPQFGARFSRAYLLGMVKRDTAIVAVMNAAKVLSDAEAVMADGDEGAAPSERRGPTASTAAQSPSGASHAIHS